jgi:dTDP-glucose 4,6-dehydratase
MQLRDYLFVDDVIAGLHAAHRSEAEGVLNLASGEARRLVDIAARVRDLIDPTAPIESALPYRQPEPDSYVADIGAITRQTGWRPAVSFDDGLQRTVDWFRRAYQAPR